MKPRCHGLGRALLGLSLTMSFAPALYADPRPQLEATPLLGVGPPAAGGWFMASVKLEHLDATTRTGIVEARHARPFQTDARGPSTQAVFAAPTQKRLSIALPVHSVRLGTELYTRALDTRHEELASARNALSRPADIVILDFDSQSRLQGALAGAELLVSGEERPLLVEIGSPSSASFDGSEGDQLTLSAAYSGVTLAIASVDQVRKLSEAARSALFDWVLAGGALGLSVERNEDLEQPFLQQCLGAAPRREAASERLLSEARILLAPEASAPAPRKSAAKPKKAEDERAMPSPETAMKLRGYGGGNLRPSAFGGSASYGLGEVHVLGFDPNAEPFASDPWTRIRTLELARHARARRKLPLFPHGSSDAGDLSAVRRELDPNETARSTVLAAAGLLLVYAVLAGPWNFYRARRKGQPLAAFIRLPWWAAAALGSVIILGFASRGVSGRARHLTLIEAGAGMPRASVLRFRGFYAPSARSVRVRAAEGAVLDLALESEAEARTLLWDRHGLSLETRTKPWQVLLVREDGLAELGGGVSILKRADGTLAIRNRSARDLLSVLLLQPSGDWVHFDRVADGETVDVSQGQRVNLRGQHPYGSSALRRALDQSAPGLGAAWNALEAAARPGSHFWPNDVPVLIAQIEGGEGQSRDSGFEVDVDRTLLRVVGYGGVL